MLYDSRWEQPEVKPDPHGLVPFIAWLETQDPARIYNWGQPGMCLVAQYLRFKGEKSYSLYASQVRERGWYWIAASLPHTFGSALQRAKAQQRGENNA